VVESLLVDDWFVDAPWFRVDVAPEVLAVWFADTPLVTFWLPSPTCTPGLMLAPAFTDEFAMPTFASTPTFGFTLVPVLLVEGEVLLELVEPPVPEVVLPDVDDWFVLVPWFMFDVALVLVADWFALTPLDTVWLPLPMFTPGLTLAPRFTSVLLMPTFASTPTFGFTLSEELLVPVEGVLLEVDDVPPVPLVEPDEVEPVEPVEPEEVEPVEPESEPLALPDCVLPELMPEPVLPERVPLVAPVVAPLLRVPVPEAFVP